MGWSRILLVSLNIQISQQSAAVQLVIGTSITVK